MSINIRSQCLLCHLNPTVETVRPLGTEEQTMAFVQDLLRLYLRVPENVGSPWLTPDTNQLLLKHYGIPLDRYRQEKIDSNAFAMERYDMLRDRVFSAPDPVFAGIQYAVLGNYLDFAALQGKVSFEKLNEMLDNALHMELDKQVYEDMCQDLGKAKTLLYVTDNAGEIVFDRICAEAIARKYPNLAITFCVRGDIANNDATREDAAAVGIPFPVIDNGNNVPGTQMDMLSEEAELAFRTSDVIFAKGMANVETMFGCGLNVYYAFLVKCARFVERFGKEMLSPVLVKDH